MNKEVEESKLVQSYILDIGANPETVNRTIDGSMPI
jgi:hypothetical protein